MKTVAPLRSFKAWADNWPFAARGTAAKAWRFVGEMHEIGDTFASAGLPDGFHRAAADVYARMAGFHETETVPTLEDVVAAVVRAQP